MRVILLNAPLASIVSDHGVGHQIPLGLLMLGGPLLADGHEVVLVDAAVEHLPDDAIAARVAAHQADVVLVGHAGSTCAHPAALRALAAAKAARPGCVTLYGGPYPSYHDRAILAEHPEVDGVVRGEGEATVRELVARLAATPAGEAPDLSAVDGLTWRRDDVVVVNKPRAPIEDLDAMPIAWSLVQDWDRYQAFGRGRAAVVQWSRGCPHTCTYCGQWMFWKRWRHRDPERFADELAMLHREHGVNFFWLADENPTSEPETWRRCLEAIAARGLDVGMCGSLRATDIVRDEAILPLYKRAGFLYILMGIESVTDETLAAVRKGACVDDGWKAVRLLREHGILSIVDYMFGLEAESPATIWRAFRGLVRYDGDFVNALYATPHDWTPYGRAQAEVPVVERDLARWDYRHQVLAVPGMSPGALFLGVKLVEAAFHLRPRRLARLVTTRDRHARRQLRFALWHDTKVFVAEVAERLKPRA